MNTAAVAASDVGTNTVAAEADHVVVGMHIAAAVPAAVGTNIVAFAALDCYDYQHMMSMFADSVHQAIAVAE